MSVAIGARISDFTRKMKDVTRSIRAIPNSVTTKVNVKVDEFHRKMDKIANTMRSFGTVAGSALKGGLISVLPALAPIIASLAGGLGGLVTSFAAAGTGAAMFGTVAVSALNDVFSANSEIKDLRKELANTTDLEKRAELNEQIAQAVGDLSKEQQKGLKALQSFSKFWGKFSKRFQKPVMDIFVRSLGQLQGLITDLKPAFDGSVKAVDTLSKSLGKSMQTKEFKKFIDFMNKSIGPALIALGKSFGNVMQGIMNLMVAFGPLSVDMQGGLVKMTKRFADWAAGLSESKTFEKFIDFVKKNGPKVMSLIGNLTTFLINLGVGMAPLGSKILDLVNGFLRWTDGMMKANPIIGQIVAWLITLGGILLTLVPGIVLLKTAFGGMASTIMTGLGNALKFIWGLFTNFKKTIAPLTSKLLPLLRGGLTALRVAFTVLTGPIGIIIGIISLLIPVFVRLWKENEAFRLAVLKAWTIIQTVFTTVIGFITNLVKTVIGELVLWWKANQDKFMAIAQKVWDTVYSVISTIIVTIWDIIKKVVTKIKEFWDEHGTFIMKVAKKAWDIITTIVKTAIDIIWPVIKGAIDLIKGIFQTVWPIISGVVEIAWGIIKTAVKTTIDVVAGIIDAVMSAIKGDWKGAWDAIKGICEDIWKNIEGFFKDVDLKEIGKDMIKGLIKGVKHMAKATINAVKGVVGGAIDGAKNLLGIASPSKLFKRIGEYTGQGFINGMTRMNNKVVSASKQMAQAAVPKLQKVDYGAQMKSSIRNASGRVRASVDHMINGPKLATEGVSGASNKEQYAILNIGGYEAKGVIRYISNEQERESDIKRQFRG